MKPVVTLTLLSALALAAAGCGESHAARTPDPEPTRAATYKSGHGLRLTPVARSFVALATADVTTRDFPGAQGGTAIPTEALLRTVKGDFVYVANGEWFLRTPVTIGTADATAVQVRDGLYEGDTVVVRGVRALWLAELQAVNGGVGCADGL